MKYEAELQKTKELSTNLEKTQAKLEQFKMNYKHAKEVMVHKHQEELATTAEQLKRLDESNKVLQRVNQQVTLNLSFRL